MTDLQATDVSMATRADLTDVLALLRQCELLETGVADAIDGFCVARAAGTLVGCAGLETYAEFGLLRSVAVEPSARGAGLGGRLVAKMASAATARGLSQLFLLTTTAARFFDRRGFHAVPRASVPPPVADSWEFRVGCPESALAMRLALRD